MTAPRMPTKLGASGKALWSSIIPAYDLRPDELRILIDACREADLIARLQDALESADLGGCATAPVAGVPPTCLTDTIRYVEPDGTLASTPHE